MKMLKLVNNEQINNKTYEQRIKNEVSNKEHTLNWRTTNKLFTYEQQINNEHTTNE